MGVDGSTLTHGGPLLPVQPVVVVNTNTIGVSAGAGDPKWVTLSAGRQDVNTSVPQGKSLTLPAARQSYITGMYLGLILVPVGNPIGGLVTPMVRAKSTWNPGITVIGPTMPVSQYLNYTPVWAYEVGQVVPLSVLSVINVDLFLLHYHGQTCDVANYYKTYFQVTYLHYAYTS